MEKSSRFTLKVSSNSDDSDLLPRVAVSACLLGEPVRYDGNDKRSNLVLGELSEIVCWRGFCPEVAAGMGVPRPTIGLYQEGGEIQLRINPGQSDKFDTTENLAPILIAASEVFLKDVRELDAYVLMSRSPSCGLESVLLRGEDQLDEPQYIDGVFAAELKQRYPYLPIVQECDLQKPSQLNHFLTRAFACRRLRDVFDSHSFAKLLDFHGRYKYLLMAHSVPAYKSLGRLLAKRDKDNFSVQISNYRLGFMQALNAPSSCGGEVNALMHMMGYIKNQLRAEQRKELLARMESYRLGNLALQVVVDELHNYVVQWGSDYIRNQYFWEPHPLSKQLRAQS